MKKNKLWKELFSTKSIKDFLRDNGLNAEVELSKYRDVQKQDNFDLLEELEKDIKPVLDNKQKKMLKKLKKIKRIIPITDEESTLVIGKLIERVKLIGDGIDRKDMVVCNEIWKKYNRF